MTCLKEKFDKALSEALIFFKKNKNVIGILVAGSYVSNNISKNSDIDLFIVTKESSWRERGVKIFNGVEVEYFLQPYGQVIKYFNQEVSDLRRVTLDIFSSAIILYDPKGRLRELVNISNRISKNKLSPLSLNKLNLIKYFIGDYLKDLADGEESKDYILVNLIANSLFIYIVESYFMVKRCSRPKLKYILDKIDDKDFKIRILKFLKADSIKSRVRSIKNLANYFLKINGGKLSREYNFKFKSNY